MPRKPAYSSHLNNKQQSTGGRPLIVLCLVSILMLTFYLREGDTGPVHALRSVAMTVTSPVRMLGSVVASPFNVASRAVDNATASSKTLEDLRRENERLTAQVAELTEAANSAERLEKLVDLQSTYKLSSTAARIIGSTGDAWTNTVTIDKGKKDGLAVGMPVCSAGGVIGQITEVSATTATVRLITDDQSGVSAMVQSSRAQGVLSGQADGTLRLEYVVADAAVSAGDIIITSGLGGMFPKGLPLGTVASVERSANDVYYTIVVRPASLAEYDEEVLVITALDDEQMASDDEVAQANAAPQGGEPKAKQDDTSSDDASDSGNDTADGE